MREVLFYDALAAAVILGIGVLLRMINPRWFTPRKTRRIPGRRPARLDGGLLIVTCLVIMVACLAASDGSRSQVRAGVVALVGEDGQAPSADARLWLKPDSIVRFSRSEVACLDASDLEKTVMLGRSGKGTKLNAYFTGLDGTGPRCRMLSPDQEYKVIDASANDWDRPQMLLADVVDKDVVAAEHGAYVLIPDRSWVQVVR
jgi:hypothetical protein